MADEEKDPKKLEEPKGGEPGGNEPPADDGGKPDGGDEEPKGGEPSKGETVNRHKHEREVGKLQKRIDELEAENNKLKGKDESIAALTKRLDEMEAKAADEKVEAALKAAGCHNLKAAKACLDDYDGSVEKLRKEAPYLFTSSDKSKSTGGNPKGKPSDDEEEMLDKAFGLKK